MKILYISKGDHVDYQDDCLFIGLKELFGSDVVDINKREHCYVTYPEDKASSLYGMGMTVTRVLPDLEVDRTDIASKIKNKYFDLVVYGSVWRCNSDIQKVLEHYPKERVAVVDGEDETHIHNTFHLGVPYFKRELVYNHSRLFPISFAFPQSKVNLNNTKRREIAICDPRDRSTYIYKNEKDYYTGYKESKYAFTTKKAGWDCLRHYEILGNGCIPIFIDIANCPPLTMNNFPKALAFEVLTNYNQNKLVNYDDYAYRFNEHFNVNMTTQATAENFINILKSNG
jgi:hypothetical protein